MCGTVGHFDGIWVLEEGWIRTLEEHMSAQKGEKDRFSYKIQNYQQKSNFNIFIKIIYLIENVKFLAYNTR